MNNMLQKGIRFDAKIAKISEKILLSSCLYEGKGRV